MQVVLRRSMDRHELLPLPWLISEATEPRQLAVVVKNRVTPNFGIYKEFVANGNMGQNLQSISWWFNFDPYLVWKYQKETQRKLAPLTWVWQVPC